MAFYREQGVKIIHTWHNPLPHSADYLEADVYLYYRLKIKVLYHLGVREKERGGGDDDDEENNGKEEGKFLLQPFYSIFLKKFL